MVENLFIYGTLLDARLRQHVVGRAVPGTPDELPGYGLSMVCLGHTHYPNIVANPDAQVSGLRIALNAWELASVDAYETDAYLRVRVTLCSGQQAWAYLSQDRDDDFLLALRASCIHDVAR